VTHRRIRFEVDPSQAAHVRVLLDTLRWDLREYMELCLTKLCCPRHSYDLYAFSSYPIAGGEHPRGLSVSWPASLIRAMDPSLELADVSLSGLFSLVWMWSQAEGGSIPLPLACRLASWGSYWSGENYPWGEIMAKGQRGKPASPHELWTPPEYSIEQLPWNTRVKGFK